MIQRPRSARWRAACARCAASPNVRGLMNRRSPAGVMHSLSPFPRPLALRQQSRGMRQSASASPWPIMARRLSLRVPKARRPRAVGTNVSRGNSNVAEQVAPSRMAAQPYAFAEALSRSCGKPLRCAWPHRIEATSVALLSVSAPVCTVTFSASVERMNPCAKQGTGPDADGCGTLLAASERSNISLPGSNVSNHVRS